ncbi:unnamed protein product [Brugia pahangi]|uniref:Uncharacterized protein n=1 Tax=Brugia pahangi TaxID=6280 RepID=A0A0N4T287_BRUPA|nr:unnamed protein product [Brugia pahangi]
MFSLRVCVSGTAMGGSAGRERFLEYIVMYNIVANDREKKVGHNTSHYLFSVNRFLSLRRNRKVTGLLYAVIICRKKEKTFCILDNVTLSFYLLTTWEYSFSCHKTNGNNYNGNRYFIQSPPSLSLSLSSGLSAIFTVAVTTTIITTSAAAITTISSNCMHLMDLRESDILDNSLDTEEDARIERHMEEHFVLGELNLFLLTHIQDDFAQKFTLISVHEQCIISYKIT